MTEIEKVTNSQAKARSIYNSLIKDNIFYTGISKNLAIALIELGIDSSTTDKLSVEKLQERCDRYEKALTEISEDVPKPPKYNLNAEFWRTQWSEASGAHLMEYLRAEKLKKDNEILKKALTEIQQLKRRDRTNLGMINKLQTIAKDALAAIGGDDD